MVFDWALDVVPGGFLFYVGFLSFLLYVHMYLFARPKLIWTSFSPAVYKMIPTSWIVSEDVIKNYILHYSKSYRNASQCFGL